MNAPNPCNLRVLEPTRRRPLVGDIFAGELLDGRWIFGRVVRTDAEALGPGGGAYVLVYIYDSPSESVDIRPPLTPDRLLIPPEMVNRRPWTRGYFRTIENRPIGREDTLPQHCFIADSGLYRDEYGATLTGPSDPVGQFGLGNERTLDDKISLALGIPLASD